MTTAEQFREALAPWLEQVKALADSRPDIKPEDCRFTILIDTDRTTDFIATIFYDRSNKCITSLSKTPELAIDGLKARLAEIPAPPTREELIAQKRAELAALEGGQG